MAEGDSNNDWLWNVIGGAIASNKASKGMKGASKTLGQTADQNIAFAKDIYGQNVARYDPFAQFATSQLGNYANAMNMANQGDFSFYQNTPDYKVGEDAIQNAFNRQLAMRGKVLSPDQLDDVSKMMADYKYSKYQDWRRGQREDIGMAYPAINAIAGEGTNLASNFINQNMLKGTAKATAQIGKGNIWAKYMEDLAKTFA